MVIFERLILWQVAVDGLCVGVSPDKLELSKYCQ